MCSLSTAGSCGSHCVYLSPQILLAQYCDGLASKECDVGHGILSTWTVLNEWPKSRLTVIFLATKTTNNPIPLETYASHIPKTTPAEVLELEFLVAQSLGFEFVVWHAHRALWGIYLDAQVRLYYELHCVPEP
jgi:hypothetical protein